jgi:hypothetical protein
MQEKSILADSALGENLIFVVSQPRAGSTMLQRILGAHPDIHTLSEPWIALQPLLALREDGYACNFDLLPAKAAVKDFSLNLPEGDDAYCEALRRMLNYLYGRALEQSEKSIFLDKTPRYYLIIPEILRVFPRARVVFLLRNPVAVLVSILETWCKTSTEIELSNSISDLMAAPQFILNGIRRAGADAIVARYEELVTTPVAAVGKLCQRLGIVFHPSMIEYGAASANSKRWNYGDQGTVYRESSPVEERAERWREVLKQKPEWASWARGYIAALGRDVVNGIGYDYEEFAALPGGPERDVWQALMKPPHDAVIAQLRQDLLSRTTTLEEVSALLEVRTAALEAATQDRQSCTAELVAVRHLLVQRTDALNRAAADLHSRTADLVAARRLLAERTEALERLGNSFQSQTSELIECRRLLVERGEALDAAAADLISRTAELVEERRLLRERTEALDSTARDLETRTTELIEARRLLRERTNPAPNSGAPPR